MSKQDKLDQIQGKWAYLWHVRNIFSGDVQKIVTAAVDAGMTGIALKICNGTYAWDEPQFKLDDVVQAIDEAGLGLILWGYQYLKWSPLREAQVAIGQINKYQDQALAYLIDAEREAKQATDTQAKLFMDPLRDYTDHISLPIALNTYRYPSYHRELPWGELRKGTDFDCPQVYYRNGNPIYNVKRSRREYAAMNPRLPYLPAGDMYREHGIQPYPGAVTEFLQYCKDDPEVNFAVMWAMDQIESPASLWKEFADFDWPVDGVPPDNGDDPPPDDDDDPDPPPPGETIDKTVKAWLLNVRSGPGLNYPVVGQLSKGTSVSVYDVSGCWGKISQTGHAWVHMDWIE